jgi:hypothetical protein
LLNRSVCDNPLDATSTLLLWQYLLLVED